jgi:ssDNA-binding Zn-finger/Zn-ribbon topoisomerase 1
MKTVNTSNLPLIDYRTLVPFQKNLKFLSKDNYQKLLLSIKENGFFVPVFVWFDGGTPYIMDSHQRMRVLTKENIEFENTGFEVPYIEIYASDEKDAAARLLVLSSQYGTATREGLDEYLAAFELPELEMEQMTNFDAIFSFKIEEEPTPDPLEIEEKTEKKLKEIQCPECGHHNIISAFSAYDEDATT